MAEFFRERLRSFYREYWLPSLRSLATSIFRRGVDLARALGLIRPAAVTANESFLIISLAGHLGDTVMLLPMIEALRHSYPKSRIDVAVGASAASLLRSIAIVDRVHSFKISEVPPTTFTRSVQRAFAVLTNWWGMRTQFQASTVILPRWGDDLFRSTTLAYLTQAPRRIGFASDVLPGQKAARYRDRLMTDLVRGGLGMHEPARFVYLLEQAKLIPLVDLGAVSTSSAPALIKATQAVEYADLAKRFKLPPAYAVIAPGASMPRRVYPVEQWLPVIEHLARRGILSVILGGPSDAETGRALHLLAPDATVLVVGSTTLIESAALIAHAACFLGNDSGPGHLAGALGVPSVIVFIAEEHCDANSPAAPERVRPAGPRVQVVRLPYCLAPCNGSCTAPQPHCIASITPAHLIAMLDQLIGL